MRRRIAVFTFAFLALNVLSLRAADRDTNAGPQTLTDAAARAGRLAKPAETPSFGGTQARPLALPILYGTYGILQGMDLVSTRKALAAGAHETNPSMHGVGTMLAVKAATGAATIYFAERAWKKNRIGGIALMAVLNGATAAVVAHNMKVSAGR